MRATDEEGVRRSGNYAMFDQMAWNIPNHEVGWQIRYNATPSSEARMIACAEMDCYARLIVLPQRERNRIIRNIRRAIAMDSIPPAIAASKVTA